MAVTQAQIKQSRVEARRIVMKALGKPLPPRAQVHHVDGNPLNNVSSNLVLCENNAYHKLLHVRERALRACGNVNWRKCNYCKKYDDPSNMIVSQRRGAYHKVCLAEYSKKYSKEYCKNGNKGKKALKLETAINQFLTDLRNVNY